MFRSLALGSMSVASASCGKSSAASSYDSSSKSNKWNNDLTEMNLKINKLSKYIISCLEDGSGGKGLAEVGIGILNLFGGMNYDYPDHWFLIAETKPTNFIKDIFDRISLIGILGSIFGPFLDSLKNVDTKVKKKKEVKKIDINESLTKFIEKFIENLFAQNSQNNILHEIYGKEIVEDLVGKLKGIKEIKELLDFSKNLDNEKYKKVCYFLIEKGENGKVVKFYKTKDAILDDESKNYHDNECELKCGYYMNKETTIKELKRYVETLSDSYNLIDDNCQDFVRNILNHYNLK